MSRIRAVFPLALSVAVLAAVWVEVGANFTFHWVTDGDLGIGLALPASFHLVLPAAFMSWGLFFAAGADVLALRKTAAACVVGATGALALMFLVPRTAAMPDFWAIALWTGVIGLVLVLGSVAGDWYYVPGIFVAFASVLFWWIATGMDGWSPNGGGGEGLEALASPATAGTGAFGGVLSTPYLWVYVSVTITLLVGCALGALSVGLSAVLMPKRATVAASVDF